MKSKKFIKEHDEAYAKFRLTRRKFLKSGSALATMAGVFSVMNGQQVAGAASQAIASNALTQRDSVIKRAGDADVCNLKKIGYQEGWLGTSKIVGHIEQPEEYNAGFMKAIRGLLGADAQQQTGRFIVKHPLGNSLWEMLEKVGQPDAVDGPVASERLPIPDPERMSRHIKETAKFLRADVVGIGELQQLYVYKHHTPSVKTFAATKGRIDNLPEVNLRHHKYVIGILVDQNIETLLGSTGYDGISGSMSMNAYLSSAVIACSLAGYIRGLGYSARASHFSNYLLSLPPALISCGLGEMSRTGDCIINPQLGLRFKAAVVTTDLPLKPDGPIDFGLRDFCSKCKKCAENCPAQAISHDIDQKEFHGYMKWVGCMEKCTVFRTTNREGSSCGRCIKVCPWSNKETSWIHDAGLWAASRSGRASNLLKDLDDMFGYGTEVVERNRWWLEWPELYK